MDKTLFGEEKDSDNHASKDEKQPPMQTADYGAKKTDLKELAFGCHERREVEVLDVGTARKTSKFVGRQRNVFRKTAKKQGTKFTSAVL